jgi:hypothetical protein
MAHDHDFSALQNLLAMRRADMPVDAETNRFLIEFHRRQRAQLLVRESAWSRLTSWIGERTEGLRLFPVLSCASGVAAIALMSFIGFSQQVQVAQVDGQYKLSLRTPTVPVSFAMVNASFPKASSASGDNLNFSPGASKPSATRFILENSRVAYDATVAF